MGLGFVAVFFSANEVYFLLPILEGVGQTSHEVVDIGGGARSNLERARTGAEGTVLARSLPWHHAVG